MANTINYDPDEHLSSPSSEVANQVLHDVDSSSIFDMSSPDTRSNIDPFQSSSNGSPLSSTSFSPNGFIDPSTSNLMKNEIIDHSFLTQSNEKLEILAQPRALYRERYSSETDPTKHRAQRFIRSDDDYGRFEYPTIQIPSKWRDHSRNLYIRVTLVTVVSDTVPIMCVHPYMIDAQENNVLRDLHNNSLFFPITRDEIISGRKSFRISRKKMVQHELKSYGPLHVFDTGQSDIQRVMNSNEPKQIIETYQLWKSQLVFTIAEHLFNNMFPIPVPSTSVISQIMCDESSRRDKMYNNDTISNTTFDNEAIICTPKQGSWNGGDEVMMTIPMLDKRKVFNIYFDYGLMGKFNDIKYSFVDSKTIFFQTPPCTMLMSERNLIVPIIVMQGGVVIARIDFTYLTLIENTQNLCSRCQCEIIMNNNYMNSKRRYLILDQTETDGGEMLAQQMIRSTSDEKFAEPIRRLITDDKISKFEKYLNLLQDAIVEFVRTNNPSRLFRRTRLLLLKYDQNPPPLDDAIRHGHLDLALKLIEQVADMSTMPGLLEKKNHDGETPLLLAAKLNQWSLIEAILKKRLDLVDDTDKDDNNILHLLANIHDSKATDTIKNVLTLLPNSVRRNLLKMKNKNRQTPIQIAQSRNNAQYADILKKL